MPLQLSCRPAARGMLASARRLAAVAAVATIGVAAYLVPSGAAFAQIARSTTDGTPQIDASIADKDWTAALRQLDARLASNPRDVQAKFKRATVLARLGRDDDAIQGFTELTQMYPELPEPYNNLAALYAKKGRYENARNALETAVKANPGYALAYDNLGDLYLRLASESYKRAQSLGSTSPVSRQRVTDIQKIITPPPVNRKMAGAASGTRAAAAPHAASDEWAPTRGTVPSPDLYSPFGGPSGSLPTAPYTAPYTAPANQP
ncbi:TPR repeat [Candidatus Burkholderia verschuerenii]|uniref:TPR repeat n=1 Tax=Candidatus Burkholderia verschuerenii TaxID=242163 RepID=A0A0L0MIC8_9BURK|nr:tetratricopeptide repeat protein [Candidatus Burkholderia verschuerenii]KND62050.1 TPR repeat [Candidatus Burkholderia verschuerenii]